MELLCFPLITVGRRLLNTGQQAGCTSSKGQLVASGSSGLGGEDHQMQWHILHSLDTCSGRLTWGKGGLPPRGRK